MPVSGRYCCVLIEHLEEFGESMWFPVIVHKQEDSDFGITIPDLPGVFASGVTVEDALEDAREAILLRFCDDLKCVVPHPSTADDIKATLNPETGGWIAMLEIAEEAFLGVRDKSGK